MHHILHACLPAMFLKARVAIGLAMIVILSSNLLFCMSIFIMALESAQPLSPTLCGNGAPRCGLYHRFSEHLADSARNGPAGCTFYGGRRSDGHGWSKPSPSASLRCAVVLRYKRYEVE